MSRWLQLINGCDRLNQVKSQAIETDGQSAITPIG
jgi:hypothetical protein